MTLITLTFTTSETQTLSGIPDRVAISTNIPATIYYTLDGSLPTLLSELYITEIELPTNINSITLSAIAYYLDSDGNLVPSSVLSEFYYTDQSALDRTRYIHFEGVVYSYPGGQDIPYYYDETGEVGFSVDIPIDDVKKGQFLPDRDVDGNYIEFTEQVDPVPPEETVSLKDDNFTAFSTPTDTDFNPEALSIEIDGRDGAPEQIVKLINGPYMSLRSPRSSYGGIEFFNHLGTNYISGGAIKAQYDRKKGIVVFNYFDSNTGRWVKSIQNLDSAPTPNAIPKISQPLVFPWFKQGRQQAF